MNSIQFAKAGAPTMTAIKIEPVRPKAVMPIYATEGAAGADLCSAIGGLIEPGQPGLIPTGLKMEIPAGYEVQIRPRSGLALKYGVTVLNAPGTIDSDYRGEVGVLLVNHGPNTFHFSPGDRIAQMVVAKVERLPFQLVDRLSDTERGAGGFGSTGVSA